MRKVIQLRHALLGILVFGSLGISSNAATWVISPDGSGNGTTNSPGSHATAAAHTGWAASIAAGDTILMRGGIYDDGTNHLNFGFSGSADNHVVWQSFPGELARVTRRHRFAAHGYHEFRDIEFYDPNMGELLPDGRMHGMFDDNTGPGNYWVNCFVHDMGNVWGGNSAGIGIHGCIGLNIGMSAQDHVLYPACLLFDNNIIGWTSGSAIENGSPGMMIGSNILFCTSETIADKARDIGLAYDGSVVGNCLYGRQIGPAQIYLNASGTEKFVAAGNFSVGYAPLSVVGVVDELTATNNVLVQNQVGAYSGFTVTQPGGTRVVNNNYYYNTNGACVFSYTNVGKTFPQWKTATGFDLVGSTATDSAAPADFARVYRNRHNPKRATVAIYNFTLADNVSANLSGVLASGDSYQIINAQKYGDGAIVTGTFGGSTISFPMTNLPAAQALYGTNTVTRVPTSPEFAAFVVIGTAAISSGGGAQLAGNFLLNGRVVLK